MKSETSSDIPARRASVTESVKGDGFSFAVTVGFHPTYGSPLEVFLTQRGKSGTPLEVTLYDLGDAGLRYIRHQNQGLGRGTSKRERKKLPVRPIVTRQKLGRRYGMISVTSAI